MHNIRIKWLVVNGATLFVVAYLQQYYSVLEYLLSVDPSRMTLIIPGLYALCTLYTGVRMFGGYPHPLINFKALSFYGGSMMGLGLLGTLIGSGELFAVVGTMDIAQSKSVLLDMSMALSRALITTEFGIGFALALAYQNALVFGDYGSE